MYIPLSTTDIAWCLYGTDDVVVLNEDDNIILTITLSAIINYNTIKEVQS